MNHGRRLFWVIGLSLGLALPGLAYEAPPKKEIEAAKREFVQRMVTNHGFDEKEVSDIIAGAKIQQKILDAISKPAERTLEWREYRKIFLTDKRVSAGVEFWQQHLDSLSAANERYGVPPQMIVAIIGVESFFGRITGGYRVLDALGTLAFAYPPRAKFFAGELEQFLILAREEAVEPTTALGSYAGAMGAAQFIPSSYRHYAVDESQDGKRDLWGDWTDVIGSVANYFERNGWKTNQPVIAQATLSSNWNGPKPKNRPKLTNTIGELSDRGYVFATDLPNSSQALALHLNGAQGEEYWIGFHNFAVITRYNRSVMYALAAYQLGEEILKEYERNRTAQR